MAEGKARPQGWELGLAAGLVFLGVLGFFLARPAALGQERWLPGLALAFAQMAHGHFPWWDPYSGLGRPLFGVGDLGVLDPLLALARLISSGLGRPAWFLPLHALLALPSIAALALGRLRRGGAARWPGLAMAVALCALLLSLGVQLQWYAVLAVFFYGAALAACLPMGAQAWTRRWSVGAGLLRGLAFLAGSTGLALALALAEAAWLLPLLALRRDGRAWRLGLASWLLTLGLALPMLWLQAVSWDQPWDLGQALPGLAQVPSLAPAPMDAASLHAAASLAEALKAETLLTLPSQRAAAAAFPGRGASQRSLRSVDWDQAALDPGPSDLFAVTRRWGLSRVLVDPSAPAPLEQKALLDQARALHLITRTAGIELYATGLDAWSLEPLQGGGKVADLVWGAGAGLRAQLQGVGGGTWRLQVPWRAGLRARADGRALSVTADSLGWSDVVLPSGCATLRLDYRPAGLRWILGSGLLLFLLGLGLAYVTPLSERHA
jgi:hypothetical protein